MPVVRTEDADVKAPTIAHAQDGLGIELIGNAEARRKVRVLKAPDVPSVLVELGYVSNKDDMEHLASENWRTRTAGSVAHAIDMFFAKRLATAGNGN